MGTTRRVGHTKVDDDYHDGYDDYDNDNNDSYRLFRRWMKALCKKHIHVTQGETWLISSSAQLTPPTELFLYVFSLMNRETANVSPMIVCLQRCNFDGDFVNCRNNICRDLDM